MAFAATSSALIEEFVKAFTRSTVEAGPAAFKVQCDSVSRRLKSQQYLRTNQFDVAERLDGLEERFRVNHRENLADALRLRLNALEEHDPKWHPEILFLLLELSDQPTFKSKLSDLDALALTEEASEPVLRWEDIAKEDGWAHEAALWKSISYSDSSADEETHEDFMSESDESSITGNGYAAGKAPEEFIIHPEDASLLDSVRQTQEWRTESQPKRAPEGTRKTAVTEVNVLREVLFMLQGLETTLFQPNGSAVPKFQLSHTTWETHKAIVNSFVESGRQLRILRSFVQRTQNSPHMQVFQDCVSKRLEAVDKKISNIETAIASPTGQVTVSLIIVKQELASSLEPLYPLANVVEKVSQASNSDTFFYLELLFEEASMAQFTGQADAFVLTARIFLECFHVYLRPIRLWMSEGQLTPGDELFFVSQSSKDTPLASMWQDRFKLRGAANGKIHAPKFLHPAATSIFNAGKNIVILKKLGRFKAAQKGQLSDEPPLDFDAIYPRGFGLAPFPDLFDAAFDKWIQSRYRMTSTTLRDVLLDACGLSSTLDALDHLYFMSDGSASSFFCEDLFDKINRLDSRWHNRHDLTAVGNDVFAEHLDATQLAITVIGDSGDSQNSDPGSSVRVALPNVKVAYRLTWPILMIISGEALVHYQTVFTLLLQLKMALHALQKHKLLENHGTDDTSWSEHALFYSSRRNLLWFCTILQNYLSTLVLIPNTLKMRQELREADDVDAMISIHSRSMKQIIDEACLGSKLGPIRESMLDIFDLAIKLERGRSASVQGSRSGKSYAEVLRDINAHFNKHLRFIVGGLRSVARATSDAQSAKWDILAEMLQTGNSEDRGYS